VERKAPVTGVKIDTIMPVDEPIEVDPTAELELEAEIESEEDEGREPSASDEESREEGNGRRRRRRRRRRGGRGGEREMSATDSESEEFGDDEEGADDAPGNGAVREEPGDSGFSGPYEAASTPAIAPEMIEVARPGPEASEEPRELDRERSSRASERSFDSDDFVSAPEVARAADSADIAQPTPEPEPEPVAVVLTPPDPNRPKRGGWWSKAKAAISGS
jgi:ribonuclease E